MILKPPKGRQINRGHPLARGLAGYWLMNEGGGNIVNDLSGNGNNLTISGATWQSGRFGNCLYFNGSNNHLIKTPCPDSLKFIASQEFTAIVWFKGGDTEGVLCGNDRNTVNGGWSFELGSSYNLGGYIQNVNAFSSGNDRSATEFSQLVLTYDNRRIDDFYFYVDGKFVYKKDMSPVIAYTDNRPFVIGVDPRDLSGSDPVGWIDHVVIWNRALTSSEIAYLYSNPYSLIEEDGL